MSLIIWAREQMVIIDMKTKYDGSPILNNTHVTGRQSTVMLSTAK
jgi:hypothetical protein